MSMQQEWGYLKLYFGTQAARADAVVAELCRKLQAASDVERWFFIRYVDEGGFHLRLRYQGASEAAMVRNVYVRQMCTDLLDHLYAFTPSAYMPMVRLPDYMDAVAEPVVSDTRLRVEQETYLPEVDKYGGKQGVTIAEQVFHASSQLAGVILDDEARGLYSRKTLAPCLMLACERAFPVQGHADYWDQYGLYWLGGRSPAAEDWQRRFRNKGRELLDSGYAIVAADDTLPVPAQIVLQRWRQALKSAAAAYRGLGAATDAQADVLSLNFSHLMMNRLGIATLEEAYLATLLAVDTEAMQGALA
ncbi:thiopeptide-type bacteriocin biosynthesis protein [Xanthomonas sp. MUS 060]|uniref:thiopeptide-type bacteriocin biosynthesis protein n=1 Tax=Xanthomonas sp. MUS 060 TaxID=1588031 RepID=UPI0005F2EC6A|nr:thiopeptide-type bacteriocin biosynthesis protein [Xanthomonas sp. MUS 060]